MTDWSALAHEAAESLRGTCQPLDDILVGLLPDNTWEPPPEFCAVLDSLVFECDECGWWEEVSELSDGPGQVCLDCNPPEDD